MGSSERYGVNLYKQSFNFASAHFLIFADGGREELHGHNYAVRIAIEGPLSRGEVVADFTIVKPVVRECCAELDHRVLLPSEAPELSIRCDEREVEVNVQDGARFVFPRRDVVLVPVRNTSTECLARLLAERISTRLKERQPGLKMTRLQVEVEEAGGQSGWFAYDPRESLCAIPGRHELSFERPERGGA